MQVTGLFSRDSNGGGRWKLEIFSSDDAEPSSSACFTEFISVDSDNPVERDS